MMASKEITQRAESAFEESQSKIDKFQAAVNNIEFENLDMGYHRQ